MADATGSGPGPLVGTHGQLHRPGARDAARGAALWALALGHAASGRTRRALERPRVQFLYLHHVFADEAEPFRRLLRVLSRTHRFIGYSEAVRRVASGDIDAPYICLSYDDGLKSCLDAARIMDEFGAPGCFFVCPSIVGETDYGRLWRFCRERLRIRLAAEVMSWDDLRGLVAAGHEVGNHTDDHALMAALPPDEALGQVSRAAAELAARIGPVRHFSWPFGRFFHFGPAQAAAVFRAGMESCASAERGCHVAPGASGPAWRLCIRRDHVVPRWPLQHMLYFMARNSERAGAAEHRWPAGWEERIRESVA